MPSLGYTGEKEIPGNSPPCFPSSTKVSSQAAFLFPLFRVLLWSCLIMSWILTCTYRGVTGKSESMSSCLGPEISKEQAILFYTSFLSPSLSLYFAINNKTKAWKLPYLHKEDTCPLFHITRGGNVVTPSVIT